jgi:hypothetical protein
MPGMEPGWVARVNANSSATRCSLRNRASRYRTVGIDDGGLRYPHGAYRRRAGPRWKTSWRR